MRKRNGNAGNVMALAAYRHAPTPSKRVIPKSCGSAVLPFLAKAPEKVRCNFAGIRPRARQLLTADGPNPVNLATAELPPSSSMTASTVSSMAAECSQIVDLSIDHVLEIATTCEQWQISLMISERDFKLAVAFRLRTVREAFEKSQEEIGNKLGVGKTAISNYEKGTRALDPFCALQLKMAYNAPFEWIYGGDESTLAPNLATKLEKAAHELRAKDLAKLRARRKGKAKSA